MLTAIIGNFDEQTVAQRVRESVRVLHPSPALAHFAADAAVDALRSGATPEAAINEGLATGHCWRQACLTQAAGKRPGAWLESKLISPWGLAAGLALCVGLLIARVAGWIS